AIKWDNGNWVMRYPIGLSVLFSPFYFIADLLVRFTDYPADGFSKPYQVSILCGCLLYTLVGLYFVKKVLINFFNDKIAAVTLVCITLGTNYFFHVCIHGNGAMSHNILFTLYAIILYLTIKWHTSFKTKHIVLLAICVGLTALCRASEIICVLIPLFYGVLNWNGFKQKLQLLVRYKIQLLLFSFLILCIGSLQFIYWKYSSGHFVINPYGAGNPGEGFELSNPHILKVLFSFRKGWLVYTPIMIFTLAGFWHLYKNNKNLFTPVVIYFIINFYIVSSWSCWWYGGCYGVRALVPAYALLILPFGYFIEHMIKSKLKYLYYSVMLLFVFLNLFQTWQMSAYIMDPANMSRAYYFSTFLQTSIPTHEQTKLLLKGKFNNGVDVFTSEDSATHSLNYAKLVNFENETNANFLGTEFKHSGRYSLITNIKNPSTPIISVMHKDITKKSYTWIKASVWVYSNYPADSLNAFFVIHMKHNGYIFKGKEYKLSAENFKPNMWNKLEYYYLTPDDLRSTKDEVCIYFINKTKHTIYV
ncbi:MAG: hypothetical protein ABIP51_20345, partial [Bacteroidia bacterium]